MLYIHFQYEMNMRIFHSTCQNNEIDNKQKYSLNIKSYVLSISGYN